MRTFLRLASISSLLLGALVLGVGAQSAGAVTTLTSLGWCRGPLARAELLPPLPAANSIAQVGAPTLTQSYENVQAFTEHVSLLQDTAPTAGIANAFSVVVNNAQNTLDYMSSAQQVSSLVSAQTDESLAISSWNATAKSWGNAISSTSGFCNSVSRGMLYITQDWVSTCTLPTFILNIRWSNGATQRFEYRQSIPGPWLIKTSQSGAALPMWMQADWQPGSPGRGVTSTPGTVGGCNEETPGFPYSLSS